MEATRINIDEQTLKLNQLTGSKKTNLRRKLIIELIQSKPAGEHIVVKEFMRVTRHSTVANASAFVKRMIRDGVIQRHESEQKGKYFYSVIGAVRITKHKELEIPETFTPQGGVKPKTPDINGFVADMNSLGVKFTITITNEKE